MLHYTVVAEHTTGCAGPHALPCDCACHSSLPSSKHDQFTAALTEFNKALLIYDNAFLSASQEYRLVSDNEKTRSKLYTEEQAKALARNTVREAKLMVPEVYRWALAFYAGRKDTHE